MHACRLLLTRGKQPPKVAEHQFQPVCSAAAFHRRVVMQAPHFSGFFVALGLAFTVVGAQEASDKSSFSYYTFSKFWQDDDSFGSWKCHRWWWPSSPPVLWLRVLSALLPIGYRLPTVVGGWKCNLRTYCNRWDLEVCTTCGSCSENTKFRARHEQYNME